MCSGEGGGAGPDTGGEHTDGEAGAFFVGPVYDANGVVSLDIVGGEDAKHFDARVDAEDAVLSGLDAVYARRRGWTYIAAAHRLSV